jgi:hypothetical protein
MTAVALRWYAMQLVFDNTLLRESGVPRHGRQQILLRRE